VDATIRGPYAKQPCGAGGAPVTLAVGHLGCGERLVKPATAAMTCAGFLPGRRSASRKERHMRITPGAVPIAGPPQPGQRSLGHAHFWERALSRRQVIKTAAGGTAVALGSGLWMPGLAQAARKTAADPKPIPLTLDGTPFHVLLPGQGEISAITDLNGFVGIAAVTGTGTDGLTFDTDLRFMQGVYVGVDGRVHRGTFGFV
jgi:hypothetical protein